MVVRLFQILLFERFWKHFLKLERAYTTFKQLGDDVNDDRVVLFNNHIAQQECCLPILANLSNMDLADFKRLPLTPQHWTLVKISS